MALINKGYFLFHTFQIFPFALQMPIESHHLSIWLCYKQRCFYFSVQLKILIMKMKLVIVTLSGILLFTSCKKNDPSEPVEDSSGVYVAGYEDAANNKSVAKYWKNGTAVALTDSTKFAQANSIFVSGSDIYVAGYETTSTGVKQAKYWKNGVPVVLASNANQYSDALAVFVNGSDIYVAGWESNGTEPVAKYWKNGVATSLTNGNFYADATSIAVVGTDVYVAGYENNSAGLSFAKCWKNGAEINVGPIRSGASGIVVNGSDIYITGSVYDLVANNNVAKYWKVNAGGTQFTTLSDNAFSGYATGIAVSGSDVYVSGIEANSSGFYIAKIWKNGAVAGSSLSSGTSNSYANAVTVSGSDVYVAGIQVASGGSGTYTAKYWKNGVATNLSSGVNDAEAFSIFVK